MIDPRVVDELRSRGHKVLEVGSDIPLGSSDRDVAIRASHLGAIIVTANKKHFEQISGAHAPQGKRGQMLRGAGCVYVPGKDVHRRVMKVLETVEAIIACAENWSDKRVFITVRDHDMVVKL